MTPLDSTSSSDQTPTPVARDARAFVKIGGPDAVTFLRAEDQEGAAEALLRFFAVPASEQDDDDLQRRGLECRKALPDQNVSGFEASAHAAKWLVGLFLVCVLGAAGWAFVSFWAGDPNRDPYLLPPEIIFLPDEEILLLAPIVLIGFISPLTWQCCGESGPPHEQCCGGRPTMRRAGGSGSLRSPRSQGSCPAGNG